MEGKLVAGICGQVNGSVIPGMIGLEAGQSAFGDSYAWFKNLLTWPLKALSADGMIDSPAIQAIEDRLLAEISKQASLLQPTAGGELAIDWLNGRRTPDANQLLKGAFTGITLASDAPRLFRALVEATAFGAKKIVDRFIEQGIPVKGLIALGGIPRKSPFVMQVMADVIGMPIKVHRSEQTCAIGAAMFAATAAGRFRRVEDAMQRMGQGFDREYQPNIAHTVLYAERYAQYTHIGNFIENHITNELP